MPLLSAPPLWLEFNREGPAGEEVEEPFGRSMVGWGGAASRGGSGRTTNRLGVGEISKGAVGPCVGRKCTGVGNVTGRAVTQDSNAGLQRRAKRRSDHCIVDCQKTLTIRVRLICRRGLGASGDMIR